MAAPFAIVIFLLLCLLQKDHLFFNGAAGVMHGIAFPHGTVARFKNKSSGDSLGMGYQQLCFRYQHCLATLIAVEMGFTWVMWIAALAYCMPLIVQLKWSSATG
jgi:hypothetical protein